MLHNHSRQSFSTSLPLYGGPILPATLSTTATMILAQPPPKIGSGTLQHWHYSQIAEHWFLGIRHWIGQWISHPPAHCLGLKKKKLQALKIILHILVLPPNPCATIFGWIQWRSLGCSKPWENTIPNLACFIIFENRSKFEILGNINSLFILERHRYITSM